MLTTFLTVFAGIALLVATFSIYNTFSIIVAQRTRESALLRARRAPRGARSCARSWSRPSSSGVVARSSAWPAGIGVAGLLKGLFDAAGFALPAGGIVVTGAAPSWSARRSASLVTLLAGVVPAVKASRVAPLAALRDVAVERTRARRLARVVGRW